MNIDKILNVGDVLNVEYFISAGEEVDFRAHNVGEEWFEELEEYIL